MSTTIKPMGILKTVTMADKRQLSGDTLGALDILFAQTPHFENAVYATLTLDLILSLKQDATLSRQQLNLTKRFLKIYESDDYEQSDAEPVRNRAASLVADMLEEKIRHVEEHAKTEPDAVRRAIRGLTHFRAERYLTVEAEDGIDARLFAAIERIAPRNHLLALEFATREFAVDVDRGGSGEAAIALAAKLLYATPARLVSQAKALHAKCMEAMREYLEYRAKNGNDDAAKFIDYPDHLVRVDREKAEDRANGIIRRLEKQGKINPPTRPVVAAPQPGPFEPTGE